MMVAMGAIAGHIKERAQQIDPSAPSTTNWWPVRELVAEAMGLEPEEVYVSTISKPGNLKPRSEQSQRGVGSKVLVGMYTGALIELDRCVTSAEKRCRERGLTILVFADAGAGFTLEAIVKPTNVPVPHTVATEYPAATVISC
jgi:hypothetical protein